MGPAGTPLPPPPPWSVGARRKKGHSSENARHLLGSLFWVPRTTPPPGGAQITHTRNPNHARTKNGERKTRSELSRHEPRKCGAPPSTHPSWLMGGSPLSPQSRTRWRRAEAAVPAHRFRKHSGWRSQHLAGGGGGSGGRNRCGGMVLVRNCISMVFAKFENCKSVYGVCNFKKK